MEIQFNQKILLHTGRTATIVKQNGYEPDFFVWYIIDGASGVFAKQNTTRPCLNWDDDKQMWIEEEPENLMGV